MLHSTQPAARGKGRGLSASDLKWIAIAAMLIDHTAYAFVSDYFSLTGAILHTIGRITGPIMFFFVVEGYHHTRDRNKYTLRMALFALVSYFPFVWFVGGGFALQAEQYLHFNVIYTLLLGLLALRARHEIPNKVVGWLVVIPLLFLSELGDWGYIAVLNILLFDLFRGHFKRQAAAYCALVLYQIFPALGNLIQYIQLYGFSGDIYRQLNWVLIMLGLFLPIILLSFYNGQRGNSSKWVFYIFYPAHIMLLVLLRYFIL